MSSLSGFDWGASSLCASLFGDDVEIAEACPRSWGVHCLQKGDFEAALTDIAAGELACGMVAGRSGGSRCPASRCRPMSGASLPLGTSRRMPMQA